LSIEDDTINVPAAERCPHCALPLDIAAVRFRFFRAELALFVCGQCGFALTESAQEPQVQSSLLRRRIRRLQK
jgi:hypothetical protein